MNMDDALKRFQEVVTDENRVRVLGSVREALADAGHSAALTLAADSTETAGETADAMLALYPFAEFAADLRVEALSRGADSAKVLRDVVDDQLAVDRTALAVRELDEAIADGQSRAAFVSIALDAALHAAVRLAPLLLA